MLSLGLLRRDVLRQLCQALPSHDVWGQDFWDQTFGTKTCGAKTFGAETYRAKIS